MILFLSIYDILFFNNPSGLKILTDFRFTLVLTDKQGNMVQDLEEFPLTLAIYTSENPPKSIETNNSGKYSNNHQVIL